MKSKDEVEGSNAGKQLVHQCLSHPQNKTQDSGIQVAQQLRQNWDAAWLIMQGVSAHLHWNWYCDFPLGRTVHEGDILHSIADRVDVDYTRLQRHRDNVKMNTC